MDQNQLYDVQTVMVMKRVLKANSNGIDVGCHSGLLLDEIIKHAPQGHHWGFEPLPEQSAHLKEKYRGKFNIKIYATALSNSKGKVTFQHVVSNPGYSGLKQRRYDRPSETISEITVETNTLDNIIPWYTNIAFIKIDVEGGELGVLQGAKKTIMRCHPVIVFEHGLGAADYYGTKPEYIHDLLVTEYGMRCFTMASWLESNGKKAFSKEEFCDEFYSGRNYFFLSAK